LVVLGASCVVVFFGVTLLVFVEPAFSPISIVLGSEEVDVPELVSLLSVEVAVLLSPSVINLLPLFTFFLGPVLISITLISVERKKW